MPPKLMAPERRAGRVRGKSDPIDALAVARAALREPRAGAPAAGEQPLSRAEAARRSPRRPRRRAQAGPAAAALAPARARPDLDRAAAARSTGTSGSTGSAAGWPGASRTSRCGSHASCVGRCRSLTRTILELDRDSNSGPREIAPALLELPGCGAVTAAKLLGRDRPDRPLPHRRPARPPRRRRTPRSKLRQTPRHRLDRGGNRQLNAPSTASRSPSPATPARTRLPRTQTDRRQEPPRSHPLPQTTPRPHRLQHPQERAAIDIGATLAQPTYDFFEQRSREPKVLVALNRRPRPRAIFNSSRVIEYVVHPPALAPELAKHLLEQGCMARTQGPRFWATYPTAASPTDERLMLGSVITSWRSGHPGARVAPVDYDLDRTTRHTNP